ncbi:4Fe-4S ferredoxin [Geoalkalibacter sp.]|jgi:epoxyqueuosine reductase QueG|uniref:4Fe-4S ferredoxin n=1 Tax=Geoalkalibacter sp. TaxID=3041440 RepID=UPI00272E9341|nr:4Fe-4S ferredoxin [Geoalkalibacter sp.]
MTPPPEQKLAWVQGILREFWQDSPANSLHLPQEEKAWDWPRLAVAAGNDPWFARLKAMIGPFYWTPEEAFALAFPEAPAAPAELSVISYVLPQTAATRRDQAREQDLPAERWARSRFFGEQFNCALRLHLAETLTAEGHPAVAPERLPGFDYRQSERFGLASNWSERHTAFVAGLGTFGLSDGLITPWGKAVRFGSVVTKMALPASPRPYGDDHQAWCLWYARGTCGACARRCPADAITTAQGHDKPRCHAYIREVTTPYTTATFGTGATPCGLCQVKIPCEARVPL